MKITIESTSEILSVNGIDCRVWEGETASGIKLRALIPRIAVHKDQDASQFDAELQEQSPPRLAGGATALGAELRGGAGGCGVTTGYSTGGAETAAPLRIGNYIHEYSGGSKVTEETTVPDLYGLAFMPGCFRCEKCGFTLTKACINPSLEVIGTREQDRYSEPCPNDGTMMVHVTYREQLEVYADRLKEEFERLERIRAAMVSVFGGMGKGSALWSQTQWDKGWVAGINAAILAFDTERKK